MPRPHLPKFQASPRSGGRHTLRLACLLLASTIAGDALCDAYVPATGGGGGQQFKTRCATGQVMAGVELRVGDDVDAIRPLCVSVSGPTRVGPVAYSTGAGAGAGWSGGPGGALTNLVCPPDHPVVTALYVGAEGVDTIVVNNVHLYCGEVSAMPGSGDHPAAVMDAPGYRASKPALGFGVGGALARSREDTARCPAGLVAVGVHGRAGSWLDALGLICDAPPAPAPEPTPGVRTVGRAAPAPAAAAAGSICATARDARARNSPAAATLEARCAAQSTPAVRSVGRTRPLPAATTGSPAPTPAPPAGAPPAEEPPADAPPADPVPDVPDPEPGNAGD